MSKPARVELAQLKQAIDYLANVLEEGSLVEHFEASTREEIAAVLQLLLTNVSGLPANVPDNLVEAAAVRAIIGAAEKAVAIGQQESHEQLYHDMRQAEVAAELRGHCLGDWQQVGDAETGPEYEAVCQACGGVTYVNSSIAYSLLPESCVTREEKPGAETINTETILALWDLMQQEQG